MIAAAIWAKNPEYVASCSDWLPNLQKAITLLTWTLRHKSISVKFSQSCFFRNICRMTQIQKQHGHPSPHVDPKGPPSGLSKDLRAGFADLCGRGQLRNLFKEILLSQIPLNSISWISSIILSFQDESICLKCIISWFPYHFLCESKSNFCWTEPHQVLDLQCGSHPWQDFLGVEACYTPFVLAWKQKIIICQLSTPKEPIKEKQLV